ncbi:MAG: ketopantoate reductase family protein [Rhodobacter sp.]|nr:ketopantoate reductase family protein [Paracoccaceae bacterium]MCC0075567.1 ketopantoate reductase family protein [Rhodobacter sp.]
MRIIVFGLGAVGGVIAAAVARSGHEVIGIGRGAMLGAIRAQGLRLRSPEVDEVVRLDTAAAPGEIAFRPDDAILLCMKTQDTLTALQALRDAGVTDQPVFCFQNGVANERMALRYFPNVHGATVMMPCNYLVPGEVASLLAPRFGIFDIGRYPGGTDDDDTRLAGVLEDANFAAFPTPEVMASKYGKLLMNLNNVIEAAFGPDAKQSAIAPRMRTEAEAVFAAAGIHAADVGASDPRRKAFAQMKPVPEAGYRGGSTLQSLLRGGSVETDYLNGEIALLGRLHGVPTPVNAAMTRLGARMVHEGITPGSLDLATELAALGLQG